MCRQNLSWHGQISTLFIRSAMAFAWDTVKRGDSDSQGDSDTGGGDCDSLIGSSKSVDNSFRMLF